MYYSAENDKNLTESNGSIKNVRTIDFRSDTVTKPSEKMRQAMATAVVGDDVFGEDPTVNELENKISKILGKEAALFVPTGTMANLVSIIAHCWERSSDVIVGDQSHIYVYEQGGAAAVANVYIRSLKNNDDGTFDLNQLSNMIITHDDVHLTKTRLICIENTQNSCYGSVLSLDYINQVCEIAKRNNVKVHMDGARLFNASVKLGEQPSKIVEKCDSVSVCLSKGLGCPIGSLLVGNKEFIHKARKCRKMLGGGMRQSGIIAAAGLLALDSMIERLKDDHKHAEIIAKAISETKNPYVNVQLNKVQTNIGYIDVDNEWTTAFDLADRLNKVSNEEIEHFGMNGVVAVKVYAKNKTSLRFVTHTDITLEDVKLTIEKLKYVIDSEFKIPKDKQ